MKSSFKAHQVAITLFVALMSAHPVQAGSAFWNGGTGTWTTPGNWTSSVPGATSFTAPGNQDVATFNAGTGTVTVDSNRNVRYVSFDTGAGNYTLSGGPLLISQGGAVQMLGTITGTGVTETISAPIVLEPFSSTAGGTSSFLNNATSSTNVLSIGAVSGGATTGAMTLSLSGSSTGANTITGAITVGGAAGGFTVTNTGNWTLNGTGSSFTTANANARTLTISGGSTTVTGQFNVGGSATMTGTLAVTGGTLNVGSALEVGAGGGTGGAGIYNQSGGSVTTASVIVGITTATGQNQFNLSGGSFSTGSFRSGFSATETSAIDVSGTGALTAAGLQVASANTGSLTISGTGSVTLSGALQLSSGAGVGTINLNGGTLSLNSSGFAAPSTSSGNVFNFNGGTVTFSGASTISSSAKQTFVVQSGGAIFSTAGFAMVDAQALVHDSALGATLDGGLTENDTAGTPGSLTLSALNTYTGATTVTAGTLIAGIAQSGYTGAFGTNSAVSVSSGATLSLNGKAETIGSLTGAGSVTLGAAILTVGSDNTSPATFSGVISSTTAGNGLTKVGTGSLNLSGTNSYTGVTTVESGSLVVGAAAPSGSAGALGNATSAIALGDAASLSSNLSPSLIIGGAYTVARSITVGSANTATTGVYMLGGSNAASTTATFTGNITLNQGVTLMAATGATTDFSTGTWVTNSNFVTIGSSGNAGMVKIDNALSTTGGIAVNYGVLNSTSSITGNVTIANAASVSQTSPGILTGNISDTSSGSSTFAGTIAGSGATVILNNAAGSLALTGTANTFTGAVGVSSGTLSFTTGNASATGTQSLGENSNLTLGVAGISSGILQYNGSGAATLAKGISALGNGGDTIQNSGGGLLTLTGGLIKNGTKLTLIGGVNGINITTTGISGSSANSDLLVTGGLTKVSVASSYNGPTTIYGNGRLLAAAAGALPTTPAYSLVTLGATGETSGTTNTLDLGGTAQTVAGLVSVGGGTNQVVNSNGVSPYTTAGTVTTLTISPGSGASNTYGGSLGGTGSANNFGVILNGANATSVQVLTADNTYTGGTSVAAGSLYVNNAGGSSGYLPTSSTHTITATNSTGSGTGSGNVQVSSSAKLAGSGTIGGAVTVLPGGTLSSGTFQTSDATHDTVTGTGLTLNSTLGVSAGSSLSFSLGAGASTGYLNFANPNLNSTFLTLTSGGAGGINFGIGSAITVNLVDLTAYQPTGGDTLQLRYQNPYLLIAASSNSDYANLVTTGGLNANGYVLGVGTSLSSYTAFNLTVVDSNGTDITTSANYVGLKLYLYNGDLEVVPEPSTWLLMIAGLVVLVFFQRRRSDP